MELDFLFKMLEEVGYAGLFFWILIGASTLPVPNELIMMTIGLAASQHPSAAVPIFLTSLAGVLAAVTGSYFLGRIIGRPMLKWIEKKEHFSRKIYSSQRLMDKYHAFSLSLSYFVPGARSLVPFLYGFSKLSFKKFILFAYTGATAWFLVMFFFGFLFGDYISAASAYTGFIIMAGAVIAIVVITIKLRRKRRVDLLEEPIISGGIPAMQESSPE